MDGVGGATRYSQLHFRPDVWFAPQNQSPSDHGRAFRHPAQPVVALFAHRRHHRLVDTCAIVTHEESKVPGLVANLDVDPVSAGMPDGVANGFCRDLEDFVTDDRMQIARGAVDRDAEARRRAAR